MNRGVFIFTQLCNFLPKTYFDWLVKKYEGNKYVKSFTCWNHLLVMIFAQLTHRESLRDLINSISPHQSKFNRLGFGKSVTRSNLSKANECRDPQIFEEFATHLIKLARDLRVDRIENDFFFDGNVYAFDSTTISLCLEVFWWSKLHHDKGGIKVHTLYDLKTDIPSFFTITTAEVHDSVEMDKIPYESGSLYIFDRAYMNTEKLNLINQIGAFFVVREKHKMIYKVVEDKNYNNTDTGVMADQIIEFIGCKTKKQYPNSLRRITFYDKEGNRTFVFYTNNFGLSAENIALAYKYRWRVELFFGWMKGHLHIKEFYGTTLNAVKIQIYCAIITYCLVAIAERQMKLDMDIYKMLRILSISLLEKEDIRDFLSMISKDDSLQNDSQLSLNFF